jgi:predicted SAM-dependent methyltransferase
MNFHIDWRQRVEGRKTLDIEPGPEADFTGDCKSLSQFADDSVETIYASHVLEYVPYNFEMLKTLKEWFSVVKPGSSVMIGVPNLARLCRLFLPPVLNGKQSFYIIRMIFGGRLDPNDFRWFDLFQDTSTQKFGGVPISLNATARKPG